jgi:hypothetical protein
MLPQYKDGPIEVLQVIVGRETVPPKSEEPIGLSKME